MSDPVTATLAFGTTPEEAIVLDDWWSESDAFVFSLGGGAPEDQSPSGIRNHFH
jgi:hypothetical protein